MLPPGPNAYVMVHENEPSSIIAYALASYDYHRCMEEIQHKKLAVSVSAEAPTPRSGFSYMYCMHVELEHVV